MFKRIILKFSLLILTFCVVLYGMEALRSADFLREPQSAMNAVALLFGGDFRPLNWCPDKVTSVIIFSSNKDISMTFKSLQELSSVCEVMIGPVNKDQLSAANFSRRLEAKSSTNSITVVLEQSQDGKLFRVQGMPFSSPILEKILDRAAELKSNLNSI